MPWARLDLLTKPLRGTNISRSANLHAASMF